MANRYWITDGDGTFHSTSNWSTSSGGSGGASVPTTGDTAYFDANSFPTAEAAQITISNSVLCHINTSACPNGVIWFYVDEYGSMSLQENLSNINGIGCEGTFSTNNYSVTCTDAFMVWNGDLGTSVINVGANCVANSSISCQSAVIVSGATVNLIAKSDGDFDAWFSSTNAFSAFNVTFASSSDVALAAGTFGPLSITGDGNIRTCAGGGDETIIATSLTLEGDTTGGLDIASYNEGKRCTFSVASGVVNAKNCTLADSIGSGGATFLALTANGCVDGGSNTGWVFESEGAEISDSATVSDAMDGLIESISEEMSAQTTFETLMDGIIEDSISADDEFLVLDYAEVSDEFSIVDTQSITWPKTLEETMFIYGAILHGWAVTNVDGMEITDTLSEVLGLIISDWLTLIDTQTNNWNGKEVVPDGLNLYDIAQAAKVYADSVSESMAISDVATYALTVSVLEYLGYADLAAALRTGAETVSDGMLASDESAHALSFIITEALSAVDTASVIRSLYFTAQEALSLADAQTTIKKIYESVSDPLILTETITTHGTFYSAVYDTLSMNVTVELAGEVYECYVLNTPKFMPSMYSGFDFNSYCVFENRAFGANSVGIYELTGTTDAGATIRTGAVLSQTDFGAPNQKRFRRGYLGISGTSPVVVLETEDGGRQAYTIDTEGKAVFSHDQKSKKWKLAVADFDDLDSIKLIPVVLSK